MLQPPGVSAGTRGFLHHPQRKHKGPPISAARLPLAFLLACPSLLASKLPSEAHSNRLQRRCFVLLSLGIRRCCAGQEVRETGAGVLGVLGVLEGGTCTHPSHRPCTHYKHSTCSCTCRAHLCLLFLWVIILFGPFYLTSFPSPSYSNPHTLVCDPGEREGHGDETRLRSRWWSPCGLSDSFYRGL